MTLPSAAGVSVMELFVPTGTPSTYMMPTLPLRVTTTCFHAPVGSADVPLITCSLPLPLAVMAKRRTLVAPFFGERNM